MTETLLSVRGLSAWYGESHVLHGVDIDIPRGETVALLGRNGAGKSTTLKAIVGALRSRKGSIRVAGEEIIGLPLHKVARRGIGYVPESRGIFSRLTVAENLTLPPAVARPMFTDEDMDALFPNLRERMSSQGTKLSGGEQQMLAIARVLRTGANLLLMDEPTEGLAPVIIQRIGHIIRELKSRGMTILLVEQNFRFAQRVAERYYVMEGGRIIDTFTSGQLQGRREALHASLGI